MIECIAWLGGIKFIQHITMHYGLMWNLKLLIASIGGMRTTFTTGVDFFLSSLASPRGKLRYPINVNRKVLARKGTCTESHYTCI